MNNNYIFYPSSTRGSAEFGWLKAKYSFSFGQFFDPNRESYGKLRVLNDDIIQPTKGFGTHAHRNMEIITIPLSGQLAHKDSLGHESIIQTGEVQVMSAGSGIQHSEYNDSEEEVVNIIQIWVFPNKANVTPRYDQKAFDFTIKNKWINIVKPFTEKGEGLWVYQDVYFDMAIIEKGISLLYKQRSHNSLVYVFVIKGNVLIEANELFDKDALGIDTDQNQVEIRSLMTSKLLVIEVPK